MQASNLFYRFAEMDGAEKNEVGRGSVFTC